MTEPNFRVLCADLRDALRYHREQTRPINRTTEVLARADLALAQSEPQGISEKEWDELRAHFERILCDARSSGGPVVGNIALADHLINAVYARFGRATFAQPEPQGPSLAHEAYVAFVQICKGNSDDAGTYKADEELVRRALKRLSDLEMCRPAIEPVAVSEGLPGPEDCDALGYCWWYDHRESAWIECDVPYGQRCAYRHWLPYYALPVPTPNNNTKQED
jgi:hypothetical protein